MVTVWWKARRALFGEAQQFWAVAAEAVIVAPWLLAGALFGAALLGSFRPALILTQIALVAAGLIGLWVHRRSAQAVASAARSMLRESWVTVLAVITVGVFMYWGWMVPFPDPLNGHHHGILNLMSELWRSGSYPVQPKPWIGYETAMFAPPAPIPIILSVFSLPGVDAITTRPVFLLPGLFAFFTLQLFRLTCVELAGNAAVGSLAFLLCAFSYSATADFTDITLDLYTPLLLTYLAFHVARLIRRGTTEWLPFVLVLLFAAVVRPQVLLLASGVAIALAIARLVHWRDLRSHVSFPPWRTALIVAGLALPLIAWATFIGVRYESASFGLSLVTGRFDTSATSALGLVHFSELFNSRLGGHSYLLSQFFPVFVDERVTTSAKNVLSGLSFSVLLTCASVGFLVFARRILGHEAGGSVRRIALAYLAGFAVVLYVAFPTYPKFVHYGAYLAAPFAAIFLNWIAHKRFGRVLVGCVVAAVFAAGMGYGAYNTWGHAQPDTSLTNVKLLLPGYGSPIDRLARATGRTPQSLRREMREYGQALSSLRTGQHILFIDLEPGALVPSVLDREYLGNEPYLTTNRGKTVLNARTIPRLREALERLGVRYVYRPGRAHSEIEDRLIMRRLTTYGGGQEYVIPVARLLGQIKRQN